MPVVNDRDLCEEFADHEFVYVPMAEMYMIAMIYDFAFAKSRRVRETFDDCLPYPSRARLNSVMFLDGRTADIIFRSAIRSIRRWRERTAGIPRTSLFVKITPTIVLCFSTR